MWMLLATALAQDTGYMPEPCEYECYYAGLCEEVAGVCTATTPDHCRYSAGCEEQGDCSLVDGACKPVSDDDCARSWVCEDNGSCGVLDGECVPTRPEHCTTSYDCEHYGQCELKDNRCVASAESCKSGSICTDHGQCGYSDGSCEAQTNEHCRTSRDCDRYGDCHVDDGACIPLGPADCAAPCAVSGACEYVPPPEVAGGLLAALSGPMGPACQPRDEDDCKNSELCATDGVCHFTDVFGPRCEAAGSLLGAFSSDPVDWGGLGTLGYGDYDGVWSDLGSYDDSWGGFGVLGEMVDYEETDPWWGASTATVDEAYAQTPYAGFKVEGRRPGNVGAIERNAVYCLADRGEVYRVRVSLLGRVRVSGTQADTVDCLVAELTPLLTHSGWASYSLTAW